MPSPQERLATALAGRYRIERELGQGGMATVYLAHDLRHERRVALKVLKPELAAVIGADRFLQEIKTTANLQHPHILGLIDSGEADGLLWYVMPFVQGESLRDRLNREKQLPVDEAVRLCTEVASALDYAHRQGVIHRDIKPENILLHDKQALVADFGISLAVSSAGGSGRMTETGMSLGTPQYMSPEQAMGDRTLDARSDIYSLGAMLYEMLAGDPPYTGSTAQAIVAKVLTEKAPIVTMARETVPPHVAVAIQRALAKLAADRFASAAEFADALNRPGSMAAWAATASYAAGGAPASPVSRAVMAVGAVAVLAIGALLGWLLHRAPAPRTFPVEFIVAADSTHQIELLNYAPIGLSPDGSRLAYLGRSEAGAPGIYERRLGDVQATLVAGTAGGDHPFYSPDGEWIGFDVGGQLKKVKAGGGAPVAIARIEGATTTTGADWGDDGTIVYSGGNPRALYRVSAEGGTSERLATLDSTLGEQHVRPSMLPGGRGVLFTSVMQGDRPPRLGIVSLPDKKVKYLDVPASRAKYTSNGEVVYGLNAGALEARPFDLKRLEFTAPARRVLDGVYVYANVSPTFDVSTSGVVAYRSGANGASTSLVLVDRTGKESPVLAAPDLWGPRLSPKGDRIVYARGGSAAGGSRDLWVYNRTQGTSDRLTHQFSSTSDGMWSPDGMSIVFSAGTSTGVDLYTMRVDGSAEPVRLLERADNQWQPIYLPGGQRVMFNEAREGVRNFFATTTQPGGAVELLQKSSFNEGAAAISPDGRWLAYSSDESGQSEVYVRSFPGMGPRTVISTGGGREPAWAPNGRELFYREGNRLMSASLVLAPQVSVQQRTMLFDHPFVPGRGNRNYDVAPDGNHFLLIKAPLEQRLIVRLNALAPEPR